MLKRMLEIFKRTLWSLPFTVYGSQFTAWKVFHRKWKTLNCKLIPVVFLLPLYVFSQTILPPVITCVTTDELTGDVKINWTIPVPHPCGPLIGYVLYGATDVNGPYFVINDTIRNPAQTNIVHYGANGTILNWFYFMVTLQDCPGSVSLSSDTVQEEPLFIPDWNYVTVSPGGVIVRWIPSPSTQTAGYIIYYITSSGTLPADTVYGRTTDMYVDFRAEPDRGSVVYTIEALDGCGNVSGLNGSPHRTIFLSASMQACQQQVALNWSPYYNWTSGIASYNIETSFDNAPFTVAQSFRDSSYGYNFPLTGITADSVCFRITAVRRGDNVSSASNTVCFSYTQTRPTAFLFLRNLSVNAAGGVDIQWCADSSADITSYFISRSADGISFTTIQTIPVSGPVFLNGPLNDVTAPTSSGSLYYQVTSIDSCGYSPQPSTGRTVFLTGTSSGTLNRLTWNAFELDNATVLSYTVYRLENGTLVPDTTVSAAILYYDDYVAEEISEDGSFCYVVEATFNLNVPGLMNENLTSSSNRLCLYQTPVIYVPKAFVPGGKNNYFKPVLLNPNVAEYEFIVFDRWGKKLFESGMVNMGWDGTSNGELMPLGGYAYYVRVVSKGGVTQEKKGMVVLVR